MTSHGPGKGKRVVSTTVPLADYERLQMLAKQGGWRSTTAYIRAILEHHASQRQALAERRVIYSVSETTPARAAEPPGDYDPNPKPLAPSCCPLARAALSHKGNGDEHAQNDASGCP